MITVYYLLLHDSYSDDVNYAMSELFRFCVIISAKWTKSMAEILFSCDVCLSVCLSVSAHRPVN